MRVVRSIVFFTLTVLFGVSSINGQNKEAVRQRDFISLAGTWQCQLGEIKLPGTIDESKLAPRTKDTSNTFQLTRTHPYTGKIRYTKRINIPQSRKSKEWRLIMERTKPSTLWIDGDSIGSCGIILSPQIYEVGTLAPGQHQITIEVDNSETSVPKGIQGSHAWTDATQTNWNGIIGKFSLEASEGALIEDLQIYPSTSSPNIPVVLTIKSAFEGKARLSASGHTWNTSRKLFIADQLIELDLKKGTAIYNISVTVGDDKILWSEFDPALYKIQFELSIQDAKDYYATDFGIRDFATSGTQFSINNLKTFLRGKHDGCVFPFTGYPPIDKESWRKQFRISKSYGINHYRFHSWTPPQAAFEAANEEGIYLQAELPFWGSLVKDSTVLDNFLINEGYHILTAYGNNPSFVMMALGNELNGSADYMRLLVNDFKKTDKRRLYAFGSNNYLGTAGQQPDEDFFVTCRVGGDVGSADYSRHARSTFSFADAKDGGIMNATYPSTSQTFSQAVEKCTVPIISHESGQFQVYPDYNEISKYTGVLYPYNMTIFRKRLQKNHLQDQAENFHKVTGKFAALCYKADIETCLRTPGFGGFQLLDLQDYPGQGSAYVGILDAFMDSKGAISPQEFSGFCSDIVPLAIMPKYCWSNDEQFTAEIKLFNYSAKAISDTKLEWTISRADNDTVVTGNNFGINVQQGSLSNVGVINFNLKAITTATQLNLILKMGNSINRYDIWVYPKEPLINSKSIFETSSLEEAIKMLQKGRKVLYIPDHAEIEKNSVGGMFTPDYWNYAMFKNISEWLKRDVSPGTLSILTDPFHPLFKNFPTDSFSNWQWWLIEKNSRPLILDSTAADYKPLIQVVDNIERNHKLGLLFEMKVGKGKLLVSMCQLNKITDKPEGAAFRNAIVDYMNSSMFIPAKEFSVIQLKKAFEFSGSNSNIKGVKNITDYK